MVSNCSLSSQTALDGFKCDYDEIEDFSDRLIRQIYEFTTEFIKKQFRDINSHLLRKFNSLFKVTFLSNQRNRKTNKEKHATGRR